LGLAQFIALPVPTPITFIEDAEDLVRSVPVECDSSDPTTGATKISASAFNDQAKQPSVDRRNMLTSLDSAKKKPSDGLVKVIAREVRAIQVEITGNGKPTGTFYGIDVVHRPIDPGNPANDAPNPAHSQVESDPAITSDTRFKKLKERLAQIAEQHGWLSPPARPVP
jgi:hypothetical protein